jgi:hypothetical protein
VIFRVHGRATLTFSVIFPSLLLLCSAEINEMFRSYTSDPILVIVDVNPKGDLEIPTQAYVSVESKPEESSVARRAFQHVLSEVGAYEAEEVGVEHLLRNIRDTSESSMSDQVRAKVSSLKALRNRLQDIAAYLSRVQDGKLPVNHQILYNLQDMFNLMPDLQVKEIQAAFTTNTNDNMMTIYISSLIRSICALHDLIKSVGQTHTLHGRRELLPLVACLLLPFSEYSIPVPCYLRVAWFCSCVFSNKIVNKASEVEEGKTEAEKKAERQKKLDDEAEKVRKAKEEEEKKKKEKAEAGKGKKKKQADD